MILLLGSWKLLHCQDVFQSPIRGSTDTKSLEVETSTAPVTLCEVCHAGIHSQDHRTKRESWGNATTCCSE